MSVEILPSYTPEVLPRYDLTPTTSCSTRPNSPVSRPSPLARARDQSVYHYISDHMDLNLGPRKWGTRLPAYGRNGLVEGVVTIRSFKHVDRVVVRLVGKSVASHIINQIPTFSQTRTFLHRSTELWSSSKASGSAQPTPMEFPFSFALTGDDQELPPSASIQLRKANAYIAYAVRVDMYRRGMHMHDDVQTEIIHLPRTTSRYSRPFVPSADPTNEKRRRITPSQWNRISGSNPSAPSILLPHELRFPSGEGIPYIIPNSDTLPDPVPEVELIRTQTVKTRTGLVQKRQAIARGKQMEEPGLNILSGEIEVKDSGKEVSWEVPGLGGVSYEIRFGEVVRPVELVSNEWGGERSAGLPALELEAVGRRALHLIDMSTR